MTIMPFTTKIFVFTLIGKVRSISLKVEVKEEIAGSQDIVDVILFCKNICRNGNYQLLMFLAFHKFE